MKNVNFCSHGSPLCRISLRDWHAYISKYGPSPTWFQFKSDVTLWAQEEMSFFYVSASSLDSHFRHFQSNRRMFRILLQKKRKIHCREQVVKSNMTVDYLIRLIFKASNAPCLTICCLCKTTVLIFTLIDLRAQWQLPRAETFQGESRQHEMKTNKQD